MSIQNRVQNFKSETRQKVNREQSFITKWAISCQGHHLQFRGLLQEVIESLKDQECLPKSLLGADRAEPTESKNNLYSPFSSGF